MAIKPIYKTINGEIHILNKGLTQEQYYNMAGQLGTELGIQRVHYSPMLKGGLK